MLGQLYEASGYEVGDEITFYSLGDEQPIVRPKRISKIEKNIDSMHWAMSLENLIKKD